MSALEWLVPPAVAATELVLDVAPTEIVVEVVGEVMVEEVGMEEVADETAPDTVVALGAGIDVGIVSATAVGLDAVVTDSDGSVETTVHAIPDGTSLGSTANVICTFQNLSSWVDEATPNVHANPTL